MARTKSYMTAIETEEEMQKYRESDDARFFGKTEKDVVASIVEYARNSSRFGDKVWMNIPPHYVHIPEWQRNMNVSRALKIANSYDGNKWEVPKVVEENGRLICIDGQHRIYGAFKGGIKNVVVELLDLSEKEAIDLFIGQSDAHKRMRPADYYKPEIASGNKSWISFRDICKRNNVAILPDPDLVKNPVGIFTAINEGVKTVEKDPALFNNILKLITKLQWNGNSDECFCNAYSAKVFRSFKKLYAYYEADADKMETVLLSECKGVEFFISNIRWREQCSIFDYLSSIVEKGIKVENLEKLRKLHKEGKNVQIFRRFKRNKPETYR